MKPLRILLLLLVVGYLLTGAYQIRPEERAVVKRFGRVVARPGPGLWVGLPWGFDRVERVSVAQTRRVTVGVPVAADESSAGVPPGLLLTGDENLVTLRVHIDFSVAEGDEALDDYVTQRDQAEAVIAREAEAALTEWASGRAIDEILIAGSGELPRWLVPRVQERIAAARLGVRVQHASVALASPPDEVRRDFERMNQAEAVNRTREQRARQDEVQRLRDAQNAAYRLARQAEAYAETRLALARADADAFRKRLAQYRRLRAGRPDVLALIWWDEMSRVFLGMKERGRLELLDNYLGPDGLDVSRVLPPAKKK
jgi:membrane protease subunit HflK